MMAVVLKYRFYYYSEIAKPIDQEAVSLERQFCSSQKGATHTMYVGPRGDQGWPGGRRRWGNSRQEP